ncbi:hypothetical protein HanIR_Chr08g0389231 [Helianthus annuus]|nr:hypothetical protein HanIR_Chr08g0389231 [Helianthus annuus]
MRYIFESKGMANYNIEASFLHIEEQMSNIKKHLSINFKDLCMKLYKFEMFIDNQELRGYDQVNFLHSQIKYFIKMPKQQITNK